MVVVVTKEEEGEMGGTNKFAVLCRLREGGDSGVEVAVVGVKELLLLSNL